MPFTVPTAVVGLAPFLRRLVLVVSRAAGIGRLDMGCNTDVGRARLASPGGDGRSLAVWVGTQVAHTLGELHFDLGLKVVAPTLAALRGGGRAIGTGWRRRRGSGTSGAQRSPIRQCESRSEESRVGQECVSTCSARWAPDH